MEHNQPERRTERVKSIFDSDDSEDENNQSLEGPANEDLQKRIDDVCMSLSGEDKEKEEKSSCKETKIVESEILISDNEIKCSESLSESTVSNDSVKSLSPVLESKNDNFNDASNVHVDSPVIEDEVEILKQIEEKPMIQNQCDSEDLDKKTDSKEIDTIEEDENSAHLGLQAVHNSEDMEHSNIEDNPKFNMEDNLKLTADTQDQIKSPQNNIKETKDLDNDIVEVEKPALEEVIEPPAVLMENDFDQISDSKLEVTGQQSKTDDNGVEKKDCFESNLNEGRNLNTDALTSDTFEESDTNYNSISGNTERLNEAKSLDDSMEVTDSDNGESTSEASEDEGSENLDDSADFATLSDVWDTVNIFKSPQLISTPKQVDIHMSKPVNLDSTVDTSYESSETQPHSSKPPIKDDHEKLEVSTAGMSEKENNMSWEQIDDESLFSSLNKKGNETAGWESLCIKDSLKSKEPKVNIKKDAIDRPKRVRKRKIEEVSPEKKVEKVPTAKANKRVKSTSLNLPAVMVAFEKGWIREVSYRLQKNSSNRNKVDIYYYSPSNQKLRSRVEVQEFLFKNKIKDLSLSNFSFFKEPLGVGEKYERIRNDPNSNQPKEKPVAPPVVSNKKPVMNVVPKKPLRKIAPAPLLPKRLLIPKPQAKVVKKVLIKDSPKRPLKVNPKTNVQSKSKSTNLPVMDRPAYATHLIPSNPPLTEPRIITPVIRGECKSKTFHCTPMCEAGGGKVPNLQCVKCVCLFHSECCQMPPSTVSIVCSSVVKFLCPNCYREEKPKMEFTPAPCFEPLAFDPASDSEDEGLVSDYEHPAMKRFEFRPKTPPLKPLSPSQDMDQFSAFRNSVLHMPQFATGNSSLQQDPIVYHNPQFKNLENSNPDLGGPLRPPSSSSSLILFQPIIPKNDNLLRNIYLPSSGVSQPSTKTFLPMMVPQKLLTPKVKLDNSTAEQKEGEEKFEHEKEKVVNQRQGADLFGDMSVAYRVIVGVFSYLSVSELLVASRVCLMWQDIALKDRYWRSVKLRNICVKDWTGMMRFLDKRQTFELDLRKMVIHPHLIGKLTEISTRDAHPLVNKIDKSPEVNKEETREPFKSEPESDNLSTSEKVKEKEGETSIKLMDSSANVVENVDDNVPDNKKEETVSQKEETEQVLPLSDDIENKNKEDKEKLKHIVSSVLNEHDYFGPRTGGKPSQSCETSATCSVKSDDSDSEIMDECPADAQTSCSPEKATSPQRLDIPSATGESENVSDSEVSPMECDSETSKDCPQIQTKAENVTQSPESYPEWEVIAPALASLKSLRKLIIGPCNQAIVDIVLKHCVQLSSISLMNFETDRTIGQNKMNSFDGSSLKNLPDLTEFNLTLKENAKMTNFDLAKLPRIHNLSLKGHFTSWPNLGVNLRSLSLGQINAFALTNWVNLSSMTNLKELELDGGGVDLDKDSCTALSILTKLKSLRLFDWNIGSRLPYTLKKLLELRSLYIVPAIESQNDQGVFAGRIIVILESLKNLEDFVWGIQNQALIRSEEEEKIFITSMKAGKDTEILEGGEGRSVSLTSLKGFIKCRAPNTRTRIVKVTSNKWSWS